MRSRNAFERILFAVLLGASTLALATTAHADEKQACSVAYDLTQSLRREGSLQLARQQAVACTRDTCAEFIRTDCAKWLSEIELSQPSVVFEVHDPRGRELSEVRVALDSKPWLEKIDGKAMAIDPGQHTLFYETYGFKTVKTTVQIREGEKNRKIVAAFKNNVVVSRPIEPVEPVEPTKGAVAFGKLPEPEAASAPSRSIAPWIVGGIGVAGLAVGGIVGAVVLQQRSIVTNECSDVTKTCTAAGVSAESTGRALGPISTVGFVLGGLGVGVSAVWLLTRSSAPTDSTNVSMGPMVTASGAAWRLQGSW